eukprot:8482836-Alexandrium_andersonii.AAC.1
MSFCVRGVRPGLSASALGVSSRARRSPRASAHRRLGSPVVSRSPRASMRLRSGCPAVRGVRLGACGVRLGHQRISTRRCPNA